MGVDYHPRNKKIETFYCNISGNDLLGWVHEQLGLPVSEDRAWQHFGRGEPFRVPYQAKAADARMWSAALAAVSDDRIKEVLTKRKGYGWGDTVDAFVEWVRKWQSFLSKCSGYKGI